MAEAAPLARRAPRKSRFSRTPRPRSPARLQMSTSGRRRNRRPMTQPARTRHDAIGPHHEERSCDAEKLALYPAARSRSRVVHLPAAALRLERVAGVGAVVGADLRRLRRRTSLLADQPLIGKPEVMLDDKDRIFRNLYGLEDWGLQ